MPQGQSAQPAELWLSDHETNPPNILRVWSERLLLDYENQLGKLDLSKIVFFRVFNGRDPKCKGKTYRLMAPYIHLIKAVPQLTTYSENEEVHEMTPSWFADEKLSPNFVIAIHDDKHSNDADRMHTLLHELYHIDESDPTKPRLKDHDLKSHEWMVQRYGTQGQDLEEFETLLKKMG